MRPLAEERLRAAVLLLFRPPLEAAALEGADLDDPRELFDAAVLEPEDFLELFFPDVLVAIKKIDVFGVVRYAEITMPIMFNTICSLK